jgi:uncharacterized protein YndB with AHSA1/START domain
MTRRRPMSTFDVQSVEIAAPFSTAFRYIADPANLPEWTHAFKRASENQAYSGDARRRCPGRTPRRSVGAARYRGLDDPVS